VRTAEHILWALVLGPVVVVVIALPFGLLAYGIHLVFGVPWPEITVSQDQTMGTFAIWAGLLVLAFGVTFIRDLTKEE